MSAVAACGKCGRDHIVGDYIPANWVCDGCAGVPKSWRSCDCTPKDGTPAAARTEEPTT